MAVKYAKEMDPEERERRRKELGIENKVSEAAAAHVEQLEELARRENQRQALFESGAEFR